jgi:major membrane immunogen (membrane-anchored lipoprotein)
MFKRETVIRFTVEAFFLAVLSAFVVVIGIVATNNKEYTRVQLSYYQDYSQVLAADSYQPVQSNLIGGYQGISNVFEAIDSNGNPLGFVIEVEITDHQTGYPLDLIVGVDYNTAQLTGLRRAPDDLRMSAITDEQIAIIEQQVLGQPIPVAYGVNIQDSDQDSADQVRLAGLNDGIYYAQSLSADRSGYIDYVEMSIDNGVITMVQWDAFNTDMNIKNRRESSLDGVYEVSGLNWASQSYILCHALIDVQNPDLLAMKSDGTTDIVDGVTVNIRTFVNLCVECIENSRAGFDKDMYFAGLQEIIDGLFDGDFESLGITNDDGFIVFSFDGYPGAFLGPDGVTMNVRQRITGDMENYSDFDSASADGGEGVIGDNRSSEDGVRTGDTSYDADSVDGLPMSEIKTYIDGIEGRIVLTSDIVSGINLAYKFLKDYLNWMA